LYGFLVGFELEPRHICRSVSNYTYIAFCEVGYFPERGLQTKQNKQTFFMQTNVIK